MDIKIGGIPIPPVAGHSFSHTYTWLLRKKRYRMMDMSLKSQVLQGRKLKVTISANGWMPEGLAGLDVSQPMTIECAAPMSVSGTHIITLPTDYRTDIGITGYAVIEGELVEVNVDTVVGRVVTLAVNASAEYYTVSYVPVFTADVTEPEHSSNIDGLANYSWTITAEEI